MHIQLNTGVLSNLSQIYSVMLAYLKNMFN